MPRKLTFLILAAALILSAHSFAAGDPTAGNTTVFFSPEDECGKVILDQINGAQKSIDVAMYVFTSRVLSRALVSAVKRGVKVRAFLDGENAREYYSKANLLEKNGIIVKLEKGDGLMHNKFCLIDNALLITGSYNWTTSADLRNDENLMLIRSEDVVKAYRIQFEKYWQGGYVDKASYLNKNILQKR